MATPNDLFERLLSPAEVRTTIDAPADAVFAVLSDPETYPEWLAGAQRIRGVDDAFPAAGTSFDHEVGPSDAATVADDTQSLVCDPPHRLQLEVHAGPMTGVVEFELVAAGEGTQVRFRERVTGRLAPAMPLLRGLLHLRNRVSLGRLKQRVEPLVIAL
jgi:uncharacterized protein YndB with AHSA1/START domain